MTWSKWNNPDGTRMKCLEDGCASDILNLGLCARHYRKLRNIGAVPDPQRGTKWVNPDGSRVSCSAPGCADPVKVMGLCSAHYHRQYKTGSLDLKGYDYLPVCPVGHCDKKMRESSKVCKRCYQKSWRYGLTPEQYIELSRPENYHCHNEGCAESEDLHLDHDHGCCEQASSLRGGKRACGNCVRGWLCSGCNTALGLLREDPVRIMGLVAYLKSVSE